MGVRRGSKGLLWHARLRSASDLEKAMHEPRECYELSNIAGLFSTIVQPIPGSSVQPHHG
jgi:hypothetical protein